jgi:CofD-related protein of GAK system
MTIELADSLESEPAKTKVVADPLNARRPALPSASRSPRNLEIRIQRSVRIPDEVRIARYRKAPELGPKVLFFSGGTSLRKLCRQLIGYTHNSIHLITPFDSGGSSAEIRRAFNMLSVGDLRNRLMALADQSHLGSPGVYDLFAFRFPKKAKNWDLYQHLDRIANAKDPMIQKIPNPMRRIIRNHLHYFLEKMPGGFDLRGASLGNLILTGGYLNNRRHIEPVIYMFSKLVEVRGIVKPITGLSYHLGAKLDNKKTVVGQHLLTGKEVEVISSRVNRLFLTRDLESDQAQEVAAKGKIKNLISEADLICYPFGSFYTSLVANLMPRGVGKAISNSLCPKIYIPNQVGDPELVGTSVYRSVEILLHYLQESCGEPTPVDQLLDFVVIDSKQGNYAKPLNLKKIKELGIQIIDTPLISKKSSPYFDADLVIPLLLSLT